MSVLLLGFLIYLAVGMALTALWIKYTGLPQDIFAFFVCMLWPLALALFLGCWVWERTPWYKRYRWRQRLRVAVSEENEPDESFLRRTKRL